MNIYYEARKRGTKGSPDFEIFSGSAKRCAKEVGMDISEELGKIRALYKK